ncbi:MAG: hypothetical protein N2260_02425 [Syntrophobacterales bacterium]|nr:hypothetical protein [Syntrophobacterales bacterium]
MASNNRVLLFLVMTAMLPSCVTMGFQTISLRSPQIIVPLENPERLDVSSICVTTFSSGENLPKAWLKKVAMGYANGLQARNIGASVRFFDALRDFLMNRRECHVFLEGSVDRVLATGGAQPQEIIVSVKIRDVISDRVIFSMVQKGISRPGNDIDLYWTTVSGKIAPPLDDVTDALADQFVGFLMREIVKSSRKFL